MINNNLLANLKTLLTLAIFFQAFFIIGQGSYPVLEMNDANQLSSDTELLGEIGNRLLYFDVDNFKNKQLKISDGTSEGTIRIGDSKQTGIRLIKKTYGVWYFIEKKGHESHISALHLGSNELVSLHHIEKSIRKAIFWKGDIYYSTIATDLGFDELVKFNLQSSTAEVLWIANFGGIREMAATQTDILFIASMHEGKMLGKTDGTQENTSVFHRLGPKGGEYNDRHFMQFDGEKMFIGYGPNSNPFNLWVSDGTSDGTQILSTFSTPPNNISEKCFAFQDGKFYFIQPAEDYHTEGNCSLIVSDGTPNGTIRLNPDNLNPSQLTPFNNKVYFNSMTNKGALMSTDGTFEGTETIIESNGFIADGIGEVNNIGRYNGQLVVQARSTGHGSELHISDGTLEGTKLLSDVVPGNESSYPTQFTQVGPLLFFVAEIDSKRYLWVYNPSIVTSILEHSNVYSFKLFPNPVMQSDLNINVSFENDVESVNIQIMNILGQQIFQQNNIKVNGDNFNYKVPTDGFIDGEYFIFISNSNQRILADKFIVNR